MVSSRDRPRSTAASSEGVPTGPDAWSSTSRTRRTASSPGNPTLAKYCQIDSSSEPGISTTSARSVPRPGPSDLLVVGHHRLGCPEVDHEAEIGLVEAHPEGRRGDQGLDPVLRQGLLGGLPLVDLGLARVGQHVVPGGPEEVGHVVGGGHRQRVDDPGPCPVVEVLGQPRQAPGVVGEPEDGEVERGPVERAPLDQDLLGVPAEPEHVGDVLDDPGVGGGRGGQDRRAGRELRQEGPETAVVRAEVVAPVRDAVGLVHHQEPAGGRQLRQHRVPELGVVEPFGRQQEDVDLPGVDPAVDVLPLLDVRGVDRDRPDAGALGGGDLVPHQGQQRRHDHGGARPPAAEERGGHEVDRRLAPSGALHHQGPATSDHQGLDGLPLVGTEHGRRAGELPQALLRLGAEVRDRGGGLVGGHPTTVTPGCDPADRPRPGAPHPGPPPYRHPPRGTTVGSP